jgi:hypothetical protein
MKTKKVIVRFAVASVVLALFVRWRPSSELTISLGPSTAVGAVLTGEWPRLLYADSSRLRRKEEHYMSGPNLGRSGALVSPPKPMPFAIVSKLKCTLFNLRRRSTRPGRPGSRRSMIPALVFKELA